MEAYEYLEKIRAAAPRVHCITNYVTAHDVANMILACGANPVMADEPQEMGEITAHAGALALNMGTPSERREQAMLAAGKGFRYCLTRSASVRAHFAGRWQKSCWRR